MRTYLKVLHIALFLCFACGLQAQDKNDWYYSEHPDEILRDARSVFQKGIYNRTIELCNLHRDLLGTEHPESDARDELVALALKCQKLATDMENYVEDGYAQAAGAIASELKALNPHDERLKQFGLYEAPPVKQEKVVVVEDRKPAEQEKQSKASYEYLDDDKPFFSMGGGLGLLGIGSETVTAVPVVALGYYNIGYSVLGAELKGYYGSWLPEQTSIFGLDLMAAFRLGRRFYPKVGVGYFKCKDIDNMVQDPKSTVGFYIPAGFSLLLGDHFTFSLSASYFPETNIWRMERQNALTNVTYEIPVQKTIVGRSMFVVAAIGYAF